MTLPTATAIATTLNTVGGETYTFTVDYIDNTGIDVSCIDGLDILVTGPNSYSQLATLVSVKAATDGTPRSATYQITAPGGTWDKSDNGEYTIALQEDQISDTKCPTV